MQIYYSLTISLELEVVGKPVGECLCPGTHAHTHALTDGHPENIMHSVPSTGRAEA